MNRVKSAPGQIREELDRFESGKEDTVVPLKDGLDDIEVEVLEDDEEEYEVELLEDDEEEYEEIGEERVTEEEEDVEEDGEEDDGVRSAEDEEFRRPTDMRSEDLDDDAYEIYERELKKVYEETVDGLITELEQGNYFLGYDRIPHRDKFLTGKKVLYKKRIQLSPYGESWSTDMFVLGHNTVKSELLDMYKIVSAMEKKGMKLSKTAVSCFYEWWNLFLSVFTITLDMEEDVLFPWIEKKIDLEDTGLSKTERTQIKKKILSLLNTIRVQEAKMNYIPAGEVAPKTHSFLNEFVPLVLEYMRKETTIVSSLVEKNYTEAEFKRELLPFMSKYLHEYVDWTEMAPLAASWMDKKQLTKFKSDFLSFAEKMKFALWKHELKTTHSEIRDSIIEQRPRRRILYKALSEGMGRRPVPSS